MAKDEATNPRRDAIVRAATELFARYGFRKTSVDLVAQEAKVAKPTVYAHFADKDAVFVAVVEHVVGKILSDATAAREIPDVVDRIVAMLSAKFTTIFVLVDSSPHARELLESSDAAAHEIVEAGDRDYASLLTGALVLAGRRLELDLAAFGVKPPALARLLMQAGHGAGFDAVTEADHRAALRGLVEAILRIGLPNERAAKATSRAVSSRR